MAHVEGKEGTAGTEGGLLCVCSAGSFSRRYKGKAYCMSVTQGAESVRYYSYVFRVHQTAPPPLTCRDHLCR